MAVQYEEYMLVFFTFVQASSASYRHQSLWIHPEISYWRLWPLWCSRKQWKSAQGITVTITTVLIFASWFCNNEQDSNTHKLCLFFFFIATRAATLHCLVSIGEMWDSYKSAWCFVAAIFFLLSLTSRDLFHLGDLFFLCCFSLSRIHDH